MYINIYLCEGPHLYLFWGSTGAPRSFAVASLHFRLWGESARFRGRGCEVATTNDLLFLRIFAYCRHIFALSLLRRRGFALLPLQLRVLAFLPSRLKCEGVSGPIGTNTIIFGKTIFFFFFLHRMILVLKYMMQKT